MELESVSNGGDPQAISDDIDSASSTPFASTPSSPGRSSSVTCSPAAAIFGGGYFFSCPASPVHYVLSSAPYSAANNEATSPSDEASSAPFEFDGAGRLASLGEAMISADELFLDGKIRPRKVSAKWKQPLSPLADGEEDHEGEPPVAAAAERGDRGRELRIRTRSRRTRSMSPVRSPRFNLRETEPDDEKPEKTTMTPPEAVSAAPASAPSSRSSSSSSSSSASSSTGKYARRWIFFKDLLHRSKSEGSGRGESGKEKFWHSFSFSPSSFKSKTSLPPETADTAASPEKQKVKLKRPPSDVSGGRRQQAAPSPQRPPAPRPSLHERHYAVNRAQAEELRRRTFLPYRQGLLGCLVFGSRSYSAINGFARTLNPVSSG